MGLPGFEIRRVREAASMKPLLIDGSQHPLLIGSVPGGPLDNCGAVCRGPAADVQQLAAVFVYQLVVPIRGWFQLPLLIVAAPPGPLDGSRSIHSRCSVDIEHLTAVLIDEFVVASGHRH